VAALVALSFTAAGGLALEDPFNDLAEPVKARRFSRPVSAN
jgi:hypothetical protein